MAKYLIILTLCILGACISKTWAGKEEMMNTLLETAETCKTDVGASQSDIDDMMAKNPAAGRPGKCMRACVMQKLGAMDADGNIVKAVAMEHAKRFHGEDPAVLNKATEIIDKCAAKVVPGDKCESAEAYKSCIRASM